MTAYLAWNKKTITDFSDANLNSLYNEGYVFTRLGRGVMHQTRGLRVDLAQFEMSSENRRILRKIADCRLQIADLPYENYHWRIGKLAKDFYTEKFGDKTFSANKTKVLFTGNSNNFNRFFIYSLNDETAGYCIATATDEIIHYAYPFYNLKSEIRNLGLGMMLLAIIYAKEHGKKYIYLGSAQRPTDTYKLQFEGLEWFDGKDWKNDTKELKNLLIEHG
ncbi:MAG: hypothetical protein A3C90_01725 [Candidatus Magasanikbacteria bacterium RIFCSPHIGHO2_02_FULL_51_14]|uniref:N-end rule aminoacyl transferase C-terminal domain-containing protein n=1 Tax=Candidatus Magasanikbacteria bacterium RIFCSPHIGHO2_02_FULL_51_14 TaxID=1798683 RepID=A0A1F6MQF5_9BACT|nr:MAG: hypothetical protein A3C90_01725 [Candidatus Magasanikbacteria bacterium RIFCSPHIGHO2_02_FULL_51_14]